MPIRRYDSSAEFPDFCSSSPDIVLRKYSFESHHVRQHAFPPEPPALLSRTTNRSGAIGVFPTLSSTIKSDKIQIRKFAGSTVHRGAAAMIA
jgi:hypothetical protein